MVQNPTVPFNPYGITVDTPNGPVTLAAGQYITILPQASVATISTNLPPFVSSINGATGPVTLAAGPGITIDTAGNIITIFVGDGYVSETGLSAYVTEDSSSYYITEA